MPAGERGLRLAELIVSWWERSTSGVVMTQDAAHDFAQIVLVAKGMLELDAIKKNKEAK